MRGGKMKYEGLKNQDRIESLDREKELHEIFAQARKTQANLIEECQKDKSNEKMPLEVSSKIIPGVKDATNKDDLSLVPYAAMAAIARVREFGNNKYKDPAKWYQFDEGLPKFVTAAQRHIAKHQDAVLYGNGSVIDDESGLAHLDHAICTLALAIALRDKTKGNK